MIGTISHAAVGHVDFALLPALLVGGLVGIHAGLSVIKRIHPKKLELLFCLLLFLSACVMFWEAMRL